MLTIEERRSLEKLTIPELLAYMDNSIAQTQAVIRLISEEIQLRLMEQTEE